MTLFKQMGIAISIIIIVMLAAVMEINYQSSKNDMIQSLYQTTVNNISTLTSKLAQVADEEAMITSTIDSEFDSGYYKMIDFESNDGELSYKQEDTNPIVGVPAWFVKFSSVELKAVKADITDGWSMIGTVSVKGDKTIVYKALYKMFIKLSYLFLISVVVALIALYILLHFILKPLYKVQEQAAAIIRNEFITQDKLPYTTEFKDVVIGMNAMVKKVEEIFNKGNEAAQRNRELLYNDPTTKLFNRRYLMLKLPDLIKIENKTNGGTIIFIALMGAEILNQNLGRRKADDLFMAIGDAFNDLSKQFEARVVARVNGTEFTLMLPDCEAQEAMKIANNINERFENLLTKNELSKEETSIDIGLYRYFPNTNIPELLTKADNALSNAKASETTNIYLYEEKDNSNAMGKDQWREVIEESISKNFFSLKFWPTLNADTKKVNHKVMTFTIDGGDDKKYFYGDFIAPAINLGLVTKMYTVALIDLLTAKHSELEGSTCSIRLSNEFIKDPQGIRELSYLFEKHAKILGFKLSFEVPDSFATHNTALVKSFVTLFAKYGFGFGINSFTGESKDFGYLKELNPQFIKADCAFLLDQSKDSMSALQIVTDSLGIEIIATFVKDKEQLQKLQEMHINTVQGPVTDKLS